MAEFSWVADPASGIRQRFVEANDQRFELAEAGRFSIAQIGDFAAWFSRAELFVATPDARAGSAGLACVGPQFARLWQIDPSRMACPPIAWIICWPMSRR
jgi:hypothetical protein